MIKCMRKWQPTEAGKVECLMISGDEPETMNISGADVVGIDDDLIIQAGSVLITPNSNYVCFEDGVLTAKV